MIPKGSNEQSQLQYCPFLCSKCKVKSDPRKTAQYVITQLFTSKSWILSNVTVVKVKIARYFHLLLSTNNFNFKNSIFLITVCWTSCRKNDHSSLLAPSPSSETLRAPSIPKCLWAQWNFKGADVPNKMALYNHMVYYVSDVTRNEIKS